MTGKRVLFTNWFIYIFLTLVMYYWENICMLDFINPVRPFHSSEIIVFVLGLFLITAVYLFVEKKRNGYKPNWIILGLCAAIAIYSMVVILVTPSTISFDFTSDIYERSFSGVFEVTKERKIYYIFFGLVTMLLVYLILDLFPKKIAFLRVLDIGFYVGAVLTTVCLVYSYIVEFDIYIQIINNFNQGIIKDYSLTVRSFWNNRSNYSMLLMLMTFYALLVHNNHKNWWWMYIVAAFLIINNLFTISKTNNPLGIAFIFAYLLARFIITFKGHKRRNIITASIIVVCIGAAIGLFYYLYNYSDIAENLHTSFEELRKVGDGTVKARKYIWSCCVDILNRTNWAFGAGFGLFNDLLREYMAFSHANPTNMPHNYFLQVIGEGGIVLIAFIGLMTCLLIYYMVRIAKKHLNLIVLESLMLIAFVVHGMLEANGPITHSLPSGEGLLYTYLIFVPVFSVYYHDKHPEDNKEILKEGKKFKKIRTKYLKNPYSLVNASLFIFTLPLIILLGPVMMNYGKDMPRIILDVAIISSLMFIILPYLMHVAYVSGMGLDKSYYSFPKFILKVFLPYFAILAVNVTFARLYMTYVSNEFGVAIFVGFVNVVIYIASFVIIPQFRNNAEFMYTTLANLNNIHLGIYSYFLSREESYASRP